MRPDVVQVDSIFTTGTPTNILLITGYHRGKNVDVIIDTGCSNNLVSRELVENKLSDKNRLFLRTVGNHKIPTLGKTNFELHLGNRKFEFEAIVVDKLPSPVILGDAFLKREEVIINYGEKMIHFPRAGVKIRTKSENRSKSDDTNTTVLQTETKNADDIKKIKVMTQTDVILRPGRPVRIKLGTSAKQEDGKDGEFIKNERFLVPRGLLIGLLEKTNNNQLETVLTSRANNCIRVYKGTTLGWLQEEAGDLLGEKFFLYTSIKKHSVKPDDHNINSCLPESDKKKINKLLQEFSDIFANSTSELGKTNLVEHEIDVQGAKPIKCKPYRVSHIEREIINDQINEMLENKIIEPSTSPWGFPVVLTKKKDGKMRFCVDYRKLNEVTKKCNYPIPNIDDVMTYIGHDSQYYSTLDLTSGYWQVAVKEECKEYTAFIAQGQGQYQFNVMPFGLCCAPGTFQALMDKLFSDMKWKDILIYLDDIIIFSRTVEEHIEKLKRVFQRLREAGLTLKPSKCHYLKKEIEILGFKVNAEGISVDQNKINGIANMPTPKSVKEVQRFLGMCNYYRKFIKNFSAIARPLHEVTKRKLKFEWSKEQEQAFNMLKEKMTTTPVLRRFDPNKDCELRVDASLQGLGAVLLQVGEDQQSHPIAFVSRSLTKNERNLGITELECLGCVWALSYLRHLVHGRHVKIVTDHSAIRWLKSIKDPTGKLARWAIKLSEFQYTVVHRSGSKHKDADCLSRNPVAEGNEADEVDCEEIPTYLVEPDELRQLQLEDDELKELITAVENDNDTNIPIGTRRRAKNFSLIDGVLYKKNTREVGRDHLLAIPKSLIGEILYNHHSDPLSGHLGTTKTLEKIRERYFWTGQQKDVEKFVRGCPDCQSRKGEDFKKGAGLLQPIPVGTIWSMLSVDLLGPFPKSQSGNTMVIVCTEYVSRYAIAGAIKDGSAKSVSRFIFENVITIYGAPRCFLSDRGTVFRSQMVTELLKLMGVAKDLYTTAYRPQTNGLVEKYNKTLAGMLAIFTGTDQRDWDEYVKPTTFGYNTSVQATTGYPPYLVLFGRLPTLPTEANLLAMQVENKDIIEIREKLLAIQAQAAANITKRQGYDKDRYDSFHRHVDFSVGEQVKMFVPRRKIGKSPKLMCRWFGPYTVVKKVSDVNYELEFGTKKKPKREVVHVSRILKYHDPWTSPTQGP